MSKDGLEAAATTVIDAAAGLEAAILDEGCLLFLRLLLLLLFIWLSPLHLLAAMCTLASAASNAHANASASAAAAKIAPAADATGAAAIVSAFTASLQSVEVLSRSQQRERLLWLIKALVVRRGLLLLVLPICARGALVVVRLCGW